MMRGRYSMTREALILANNKTNEKKIRNHLTLQIKNVPVYQYLNCEAYYSFKVLDRKKSHLCDYHIAMDFG